MDGNAFLTVLHVEILLNFDMIFDQKLNTVWNWFKHLFSANFDLRNRLKVKTNDLKFWRKKVFEKWKGLKFENLNILDKQFLASFEAGLALLVLFYNVLVLCS